MMKEELIKNIEKALDEIRPYLIADGGNITLIDVVDDVVKVQLEGACSGCNVNQLTLKNGVEATIKKHVPQISRVEEIK
ncbi:NifU family protein [Namhaeicola litoreus]|uniref:NifU family protein n=1 Tax=Namhaeicola litoreus TaxID=1052145 RepID=A0ABW3Y465_9FLAO